MSGIPVAKDRLTLLMIGVAVGVVGIAINVAISTAILLAVDAVR
jgi:hypothetical protein